MAWQRLQENWRQFKGRILDQWRGQPGMQPDRQASDERRQELVARIEDLAREEARDEDTRLRRRG
jgi:hypothetical protein